MRSSRAGPRVVSYDLSQGDSLFMRADSMYLFTINENALRRPPLRPKPIRWRV